MVVDNDVKELIRSLIKLVDWHCDALDGVYMEMLMQAVDNEDWGALLGQVMHELEDRDCTTDDIY